MSFAMSVFILVPIIAPVLGQAILWVGGWRAIFATILAVAIVALTWFGVRQPETLPTARRRPFSRRIIGGAVLEVLRTRAALGYTLASACVLAPFLAYLSSSRQIFQDAYQTGALFPLWLGVLALSFGCASLLNGRLVMKHGMRRLARAAAASLTLVSVAAGALAFAFAGIPPFRLLMSYLLLAFFCVGLLFGNLNALAMRPLGHIAGVGAAVVASLTTFIGVPLGVVVGQSFDGTMYSLIGGFAVFGVGTVGAMWWGEGGRGRGCSGGRMGCQLRFTECELRLTTTESCPTSLDVSLRVRRAVPPIRLPALAEPAGPVRQRASPGTASASSESGIGRG